MELVEGATELVSKEITKQPKKFPFLSLLLEVSGLSIISFFIFLGLARLFSKLLTKDNMTFQLSDRPSTPDQFNLKDYWAGDIPKNAEEILDIFNFPHIFQHFGSEVPRGILLYGKPGTGKTHFARIISGLTGSAFYYASASQFDELFVGKGAQRVRNLFENASQNVKYSLNDVIKSKFTGKKLPQKKSVIFIDELDAIGSRKNILGHSSHHATISQLLTCLDGISDRGLIFVIGATNNIDLIDPALRRSGRFDRIIEMPLPNLKSRIDLITFYLKGKPGFDNLLKEGIIEDVAKKL
jgi:cell division protease FtsH